MSSVQGSSIVAEETAIERKMTTFTTSFTTDFKEVMTAITATEAVRTGQTILDKLDLVMEEVKASREEVKASIVEVKASIVEVKAEVQIIRNNLAVLTTKVESGQVANQHNSVARAQNARLVKETDALHELVHYQTGVPCHNFPATSVSIRTASLAELRRIFGSLGLPVEGRSNAETCRRILRTQIGFPPV